MSEDYSIGYARGYEAGQQSILKLAEQPAQHEPKLPEFFARLEYDTPGWDVVVSVYQRREDATPVLVHREPLPNQQPAQQEPVAWYDEEYDCAYTSAELDGGNVDGLVPLYTRPQAREPEHKEELQRLRALVRAQQITIDKLEAREPEQPAYRAVKTFHEGKPVYVAEQPAQQEPVFNCPRCGHCCPQAREPLTGEQADRLLQRVGIMGNLETLRAIVRETEAAHGIGEKK